MLLLSWQSRVGLFSIDGDVIAGVGDAVAVDVDVVVVGGGVAGLVADLDVDAGLGGDGDDGGGECECGGADGPTPIVPLLSLLCGRLPASSILAAISRKYSVENATVAAIVARRYCMMTNGLGGCFF